MIPVNHEHARDLLFQLDPWKFIRPNRTHPRILKELADVITRSLSMTFEWFWESGEVPAGWKLANIGPFFKNCKKDELGNYRACQCLFYNWKNYAEYYSEIY